MIRVDYLFLSPKMISAFLHWTVVSDGLVCDVWLTPSSICKEKRMYLFSCGCKRHFALILYPLVQIMQGLYRQVGVLKKKKRFFSEDLLCHFPRAKVSNSCSFRTQAHELSKRMSLMSNTFAFFYSPQMCVLIQESLIRSLYH